MTCFILCDKTNHWILQRCIDLIQMVLRSCLLTFVDESNHLSSITFAGQLLYVAIVPFYSVSLRPSEGLENGVLSHVYPARNSGLALTHSLSEGTASRDLNSDMPRNLLWCLRNLSALVFSSLLWVRLKSLCIYIQRLSLLLVLSWFTIKHHQGAQQNHADGLARSGR